MDILTLSMVLVKAWDEDTAHPEWSAFCPPLNQCLPTALVVQDYLDGDIVQVSMSDGDKHFYNLINGVEVDFTAAQFDYLKEYPNRATLKRRTRKDLLRVKHVKRRYELLKERVGRWLE